jgi:beta-carotene hydroxylase
MTSVGKRLSIPRELLDPPRQFFNPTLLMFLASVVTSISCFWGYHFAQWPGQLVFGLNFLALYVLGTVIHDASHGSAHSIGWMNEALGHGAALLQGFVYPVFKWVHLEHHAHVNHPEDDPDHYVSTGGPLWLIAPRFFYHEVFFFKRRLWRKGRWEFLKWLLSRMVVVITFGLAIRYGYTDYLMNFWLPPAFVMGLLLGLFFDYLPHRPFQDRGRWQNARVYPGRITNIFLLGQNYHLIHHLWPSIPWFKYQAAYRLAKPWLDQHQSKQTLGIWQGKEVWGFLYDCVIGIHWVRHQGSDWDPKISDQTFPEDSNELEPTS